MKVVYIAYNLFLFRGNCDHLRAMDCWISRFPFDIQGSHL